MNPYSGLVDMFEGKGMLSKEGNSLVYTTLDGEIIKKFRKGWERNDDNCLDRVMEEFPKRQNNKLSTVLQEEENEV
jgi:hypothetical protein